MLRVVALPSGSWFFRMTVDISISPTEYIVDDVLVGPFSPFNYGIGEPTILGQYDGVIQNDPLRDRVGDREVFHDQISGQVDLPGFLVEKAVDPQGRFVQPVYQVWNPAYNRYERFRHIVTPGTDLTVRYGPAQDRYGTIVLSRIMFDGKNLLICTALKRTKEYPGFYGAPNFFTIRSGSWSQILFWQSQGAWLKNETEFEQLSLKTLTSGWDTTSQWVKPLASSYDTEKLKNCFYWLNEHATDPGKFYPAFVEATPTDYGDLCQAAIEKARAVNVNTLAFLSELRDLSTLIPKIGKVKDPKTWANLYLCYKYGALLTLADTKKLLRGIETAYAKSRDLGAYSTLRSSLRRGGEWHGKPYTEECRYKITYRPYPNRLMEVVRTLDRWGLYPTLTRDWDLIPFSFVFDWALDVSSALERLDTHLIADYYDVIGVTRSRKVIFDLPVTDLVPDWPGSGIITLSRYTRDTTPLLDLPKVRFDGDEDGFSNWAELTSLIISKAK